MNKQMNEQNLNKREIKANQSTKFLQNCEISSVAKYVNLKIGSEHVTQISCNTGTKNCI